MQLNCGPAFQGRAGRPNGLGRPFHETLEPQWTTRDSVRGFAARRRMVIGAGETRAADRRPRRGPAMRTTKPLPRRARLHVEPLEDRTTPATLVSPTAVTYQDADG